MKISAVIPTYNRRVEVSHAIESVLSQTVPVYEIVVVDDGSTDGTAEFISDRYGPRVRVLRQKNAGVAASRNLGIREAQGDWVAFLDSDDFWFPSKIERQVEALASHESNPGICFTNNDFGGDPDLRLSVFDSTHFTGAQRTGLLEEPAQYMVAKLEPFYTSSFLIRRDLLEEVGGFDERMFIREDTDLFFRLSFRTRFCYVEEVLVRVDRTPNRAVGLCDLLNAMRDDRVFASCERLYRKWLMMSEVVGTQYEQPIRESLREVHYNSIECKLRQGRVLPALREVGRLRSIEEGFTSVFGNLLRRKIRKLQSRNGGHEPNPEAATEE